MELAFTITAVVLIAAVATLVIYWFFLAPILILRFRFMLNAASDKLALQELSGISESDRPAVDILKARVGIATANLERLSVTAVLLASSEDVTPIISENLIIDNSSKWVRDLSERINRAYLGAFCANSPMLFLLALLLIGAAVWFSMAKKLVSHYFNAVWLPRGGPDRHYAHC